MQVKIEESWRQRLQKEFDSAYFEKLTNFVRYEYQHYRVFPPGRLIFNAFNLCPFDKTKVVIIHIFIHILLTFLDGERMEEYIIVHIMHHVVVNVLIQLLLVIQEFLQV